VILVLTKRWRLAGQASRLFGIDDGQPFEHGNVTEPLVGADEMIDGGGLLNRESHRELKGVEGVDLSRLPVACDQVAGRIEVSIQDADWGHRAKYRGI